MDTHATAPPAAGNILSRLLDEVERSGAGETSPASAPTASAPPGPDAGAAPLAGLLANPALLAALPTLLENIGPLLGGPTAGSPTASSPTAGSPTVNSPSASAPRTIRHVDRHTALICAVKPYLSDERQAAADMVIRLCRIWDTLERSGVSLSGLLSPPAP